MAQNKKSTKVIYSGFIELPFTRENPPPGQSNEDQYPESLPRYFLKNFTKKGDKIFDPFLGFGTTAFVAEELERIPYGIEADGERFEWAAGQSKHWNNIRHGDAADMLECGFPKMDFAITSPPYMPAHHKWNPLYGGDPKYAGYETYLERMSFIFSQLAQLMKRGALVVVQADNLQAERKPYTPLVRDLSTAISKSLRPEAEIIVKWTNAPDGYPLTHCLLFKKV